MSAPEKIHRKVANVLQRVLKIAVAPPDTTNTTGFCPPFQGNLG
jgi:hypothetical protein